MSDDDPAGLIGIASDAPALDGDAADRRARAARIRRRSLELIDALGVDHPLVAEALARADALDADLGDPAEIELRSPAEDR